MPTFEIALFILVPLMHVLGVLCAVDALFSTRTSQGTIAWLISLLTFPYVAVPLYLLFGRKKFSGYVEARRSDDLELEHITRELQSDALSMKVTLPSPLNRFEVLENMCALPFTDGNNVELLIDGDETFGTMFEDMKNATLYILVQFYIVRNDDLGNELKNILMEKAAKGLPVYFLYDEIGCYTLATSYLEELRRSGVRVSAFGSNRGTIMNKFQVNFRNHRKVMVIDGKSAYVGGLNAGDEYMGRSKKFGPWRDTHIRLEGPAVQGLQLAFSEDWYWARKIVPDMVWNSKRSDQNSPVLIFPSGPGGCSRHLLTSFYSSHSFRQETHLVG